MKFLLFFVSLIFSLIFYNFYNLTIGKNILGNSISNTIDLYSLFPSLLVESFLFFLIGIIFVYFFSDLKYKSNSKLINYKTEVLYFLFYTIIIFYFYFYNEGINLFIFSVIITFISSDILFNHVSNISKVKKYIIKIKYVGLFLNYLSTLLSIFYIFGNGFNLILFLILVFNIFFNFLIHKKYTNYISIFISIIILFFLLYNLYIFGFEVYNKYI